MDEGFLQAAEPAEVFVGAERAADSALPGRAGWWRERQ